ncbi:MAG: peptidyl-prolyl cis-trans isomerase [Treponema sp.]|nr:peptidyl-prolyl cis-trans isomerase [Treponema sp.]
MQYVKNSIFCLVFGLGLTGFCFSQAATQPAAIVNLTSSEPITVGQLRTEVERLERGTDRTLTVAERRQLLDVMINERLAMQAAACDRVTVSENEVNQQVQHLRASLAQQIGRQPTDLEFAQAILNETGLDVAAFREQLHRQMIVQKYLTETKGAQLQNIMPPSEDEIRNTYMLNRSQLVRPDTVRFSMIQVRFNDATSRPRARELADRLVWEIGTNPTRFDEAVLRGQGQNSDYQAGDAGYVPRNPQANQIFGTEFMDIAFNLRQGEVSRLIEGPDTFRIIKVTEIYEQKILELDDIYQLGINVTVREYIGNTMWQERQQAALAQATAELIAELRAAASVNIMENNLNW